MATKLNLPPELKPFWDVFQPLARRHDPSRVFDDFLTAMNNYFIPTKDGGFPIDCFNRYSKDERLVFGQLIHIALKIFEKQVHGGHEWYDLFGDFHMYLAGSHKHKGLGQVFTPPSMVDLMSQMVTSGEDMTGKGIRVNDPACGSGRFLIAFHVMHPGNYVFGQDIDLMCCKISNLNFMLHGCEGEVIHGDALDPEDYRGGWVINRTIRTFGIPTIEKLPKEQSTIWRMWQQQKAEATKKRDEQAQDLDKNMPSKSGKKSDPGQQLTMF